jgi:peptide/nickel transport system permease protein
VIREILPLVGRRLIALALLLILISVGVYGLLYAAPGSPEEVIVGSARVSPETRAAIRAEYNLDKPVSEQYVLWLQKAAVFDFGTSLQTEEPVVSMIRQRLGLTLTLGVFGFILAIGVGVPLGVAAALGQRTIIDRGIVGLSVVGVSAPAFATGLFLLYVFASVLGWFPIFGAGEGFGNRLWHLTLPAATLALTAMALIVKLTRAAMIAVLEEDYVTFARARGLSRFRVLVAYTLRNALVPVVTAGGQILGYMLAGVALVEVTFALPGVGLLLVDAVTNQDIPVVQGIVMCIAVIVVVVNLLTDIAYMCIDPRIRYGRRT